MSQQSVDRKEKESWRAYRGNEDGTNERIDPSSLPQNERARAEAYSKVLRRVQAVEDDSEKCSRCGVLSRYCICQSVYPMHSRNHVDVVYHSGEVERTSNTSKVALLGIRKSRGALFVPDDGTRSDRGDAEIQEAMTEGNIPAAVLYPSPESVSLKEWWGSLSYKTKARGVRLVFLDGTWRQASRMVKQMKKHSLSFLPLVHLDSADKHISVENPLRKQSCSQRMSTLESIINALSVCHEHTIVVRHLEYSLKCLMDAVRFQTGKQYYSRTYSTWRLPETMGNFSGLPAWIVIFILNFLIRPGEQLSYCRTLRKVRKRDSVKEYMDFTTFSMSLCCKSFYKLNL